MLITEKQQETRSKQETGAWLPWRQRYPPGARKIIQQNTIGLKPTMTGISSTKAIWKSAPRSLHFVVHLSHLSPCRRSCLGGNEGARRRVVKPSERIVLRRLPWRFMPWNPINQENNLVSGQCELMLQTRWAQGVALPPWFVSRVGWKGFHPLHGLVAVYGVLYYEIRHQGLIARFQVLFNSLTREMKQV